MLKLQDRGIEYGLALLSRGSAGDWKRISEEQKTNLACQIFNFADKAGDGVVEKFDLYRCLVHGPVSVGHAVVEALLENLDLNGDGLVSEEEWCTSLENYVSCLLKDEETSRLASPQGKSCARPPTGPREKTSLLRTGTRSTATGVSSSEDPARRELQTYLPGCAKKYLPSSTRNLPVSGLKSEAEFRSCAQSQSTRSLERVGHFSRRSQRSVSDSACEPYFDRCPLEPERGLMRAKQQLPVTPMARRLSQVAISESGSGSMPGIRPFTPSKQSQRSIVSKPARKTAHFVTGHAGLNNRANHDAFKARLIRKKSLKTLLDIFKGINISENGKITRREFENYLRWRSPGLIPHARSIYHACSVRAQPGKSADVDDLLDFPTLLRILYPGATAEDINELLAMTEKRERPVQWDEKVREAKDLFNMYNIKRSGWLTKSEFTDGMMLIGMSDEDIDFHLNELFPPGTRPKPVNFADFFAWYTGHPLPPKFASESKW